MLVWSYLDCSLWFKKSHLYQLLWILISIVYLCPVTQSCLTLCNPWTVTRQASLCIEFSRQEYWSGLPLSTAGEGDFPDPGPEPTFLASPTLAGGFFFFTTSATWEACAFSILFSLPSWSVFLEIHFLPDFQKYPGFDLFHCFLFHSFLLLLLLSLFLPLSLGFLSILSFSLFLRSHIEPTSLHYFLLCLTESHRVASSFLLSFNNTTSTLTE